MDTAAERLIVDGVARDLVRGDSVAFDSPSCLAAGFEQAMRVYAERPAFGWRPAPGRAFEWVSYRKFFEASAALGASLRVALQECGAPVSEHTLIGLSGKNSYDYVLADFGCLWAGFGTVPLSDAWEQPVLGGVCAHAQLTAVLATPPLAFQMLHGAREANARLLAIMGPVPDGLVSAAAASGLSVCSVDSIVAASAVAADTGGEAAASLAVVHRSPSAVHTILHTSGTTGLPKGVVYTDELWLANMATYGGPSPVGFSYQVSCMITDRHGTYTTLWNGGRVGIVTDGAADLAFKGDAIFAELREVCGAESPKARDPTTSAMCAKATFHHHLPPNYASHHRCHHTPHHASHHRCGPP